MPATPEQGRGERDEGRAQAANVDASAPSPLAPRPSVTTILGFDYGARRIGVAVGNALTRSARALEVIANSEQGADWRRLDALLREWQPQALLVGLPLTMDGAEQANSRNARAFAAALGARYGIAAQMVDERLSSREAASRFAERRARGESKRKHAQTLDALAAEIIVETWLGNLAAS